MCVPSTFDADFFGSHYFELNTKSGTLVRKFRQIVFFPLGDVFCHPKVLFAKCIIKLVQIGLLIPLILYLGLVTNLYILLSYLREF